MFELHIVVVGYWFPVTLDILFNLVKSISIVLLGQFLYQKISHLCDHCHAFAMALIIKEQLLFL